MSRRIEIELTSGRDDGSFTWRAAGARQPKGVVAAAALPGNAHVGDRLRVEVEIGLDGTDIVGVIADRAPRAEPERIALSSRPVADDSLVTSTLAPKGRDRAQRGERGDRSPRNDRSPRGERPGRGPRTGKPPEGRAARTGGERPERGSSRRGSADEASSTTRSRRPQGSDRSHTAAPPTRPKAPRLRPARTHRTAALEALSPEQRPVAEQVLRGGIPAIRQSLARQNEQAKAQGLPEVAPDSLVQLAESLLPALRAAEWHDRAEAAIADIDQVDLRDLRSVVVASDDNARDEITRALAADLRAKLTERVDRAQLEWLKELDEALTDKRIVRALKLSSRPPKAGFPLPPELVERLTAATMASLTLESGSTRWVAVIDALAFSPIRHHVVPTAIPEQPSEELITLLKRVADRLPELAGRFGIEPGAAPSGARSRPANRRRRSGAKPDSKTDAKGTSKAGRPARAAKAETVPAPQPVPVEAVALAEPVSPQEESTEAGSGTNDEAN